MLHTSDMTPDLITVLGIKVTYYAMDGYGEKTGCHAYNYLLKCLGFD